MSTVIIINGGGAIQAANRLVNMSGHMNDDERAAAQSLLYKFEHAANQLAQRVWDSLPNPPQEPPANTKGE